MKITEKFHSEKKRLFLFKFIYLSIFVNLIVALLYLQFFRKDEFSDKERIQGQRRIIRPGPRGDVFDRNGKLLIGNKAEFAAVLHLDQLKNEIWEEKIRLKKLSYEFQKTLITNKKLSLSSFIAQCLKIKHIKNRGVILYGSKPSISQKTKIFLNDRRLSVKEYNNSEWSCKIDLEDVNLIKNFHAYNIGSQIKLDTAGLFTVKLFKHQIAEAQEFLHYPPENNSEHRLISIQSQGKNLINYPISFTNNAIKIGWEARYSIVNQYLQKFNSLTGRKKKISTTQIKNHWNRRLVLPLELDSNLSPLEYAILIERLPTQSPLQVQSNSIRHYPFQGTASHLLGYVGSGYEFDTEDLIGNDLSTFEVEGKVGKSGIEKFYDEHLKGKDGSDIWRINPIGLRFEQVDKMPSQKGSKLNLSIDIDLQKITEDSLRKMSRKVHNHRILPDSDWKKTMEKRTLKELLSKNENQIRPELLLSSFKDAPFPLGSEEASTVAGFKGTLEDANQLLRLLYSKGVLERSNEFENKYFLAPPPLPPAAGVMVDVQTGEILVLANIPNFNLSELSPKISQKVYDKIEREEAWLPRAWHPGYSPASPFKLITAVAALRSGYVNPDQTLLCEGIYKGMNCHCYPGRHGELDLRNAESQSCNVYFFKLAEKLGHEALIQEALSFEMNISPKIELPSLRNNPNVPDPVWKKNNVGEPWALEDTFNFSIGQGGLRQSPLQMACFTAALAKNQKTFYPTLILGKRNDKPSNPIGLSEENYKAIIEGMHLATQKGTAKRCQIKGIDIAGKTGTAQWRNHNMKLSLAWFIGFAPIDNPKVAVAVLVEGVIPQDNIQGGLTAAPIAKEMLEAYFKKNNQF